MPQVRTLCLSREYARADPTGAATVLQLNSAQASFPSLRAILLTGVLFVPTHVLPRLTHLHLARMAQVDASTILDLLRNTPALEVLEIKSRDVLATPEFGHNLFAARLPPSLAERTHLPFDFRLHVNGGTLLSVPPLPRALATHPMRRLAFDVGSDSDFNPSFHAALHGSGASLAIGLHAHNVLHTGTEWAQWMLTDLPTTLPLSGIEEFHIRAREWHAPEDVLPHLAVYMPAVSTLLIKHETHDDDYDYDDGDDTDGHMELARVVARVLTSDGPVPLPALAHVELIVGSIPLAFCELLARALGHRDVGGRRLQRLRIRVDDEHYDSFRWRVMGGRVSEYRKTGIFDHVDVCEIPDGSSDGAGHEPNDGDTQRLGWGKWRDCVQQARHEYWEE
ncbi:hypothetical protein GSI_07924 [Ganoderma sinense ZZ0214-1]|uniref:F-box domain-containing protein n=1 Tax=Ganoderma sinense ZZ0214-1 TaxID=1077348 RepID=A0A2G8S8B1_9APHY|nr:hypothetical protein GSI_07924 [Ganoderma sinense ZZ0214-1]